jgi:hypothetical protein
MIVVGVDGPPCLPSDPQDHGSYREADERIGRRQTQRCGGGRGDDGQRHEPVDAGVVAVGDEGRTVESISGSEPDASGEFVSDESDDPRDGERAEVAEMLGMNQSLDRLECRDGRRREDREHDRVSGPPFAAFTAGKERDRERDRGERVAPVVNQVREQCDGTREDEHDCLQGCGDRENREADRHRAYAGARADDRAVHAAVSVAVRVVLLSRPERESRVAVRTVMVMLVGPQAVSVGERVVHVCEGRAIRRVLRAFVSRMPKASSIDFRQNRGANTFFPL